MNSTDRFNVIWSSVVDDVGHIPAITSLILSHWKTFGVVFLIGLAFGLYLGW